MSHFTGAEIQSPFNAFEAVEALSEDKLRKALKELCLTITPDKAFRETLLHKAALKKWTAGIFILLDSGFDIHSQNCFGQTALHYAVASQSTACVRALLERGSEAVINHKDVRGHSALHDAAALGLPEIIEELITAGAFVDTTDKHGMTPLHKAIVAKDIKSVRCLLKAGADLRAEDDLNRSPLSLLLHSYQDIFESVLNQCFIENEDKSHTESRVYVDFFPLINVKYDSQLDIIREILTSGSLKLISHPLCETFLLLQYLSIRKYFVAGVCLYFGFVFIATLLILNKIVWLRGGDFPFIIEGLTYTILFSLMLLGAAMLILRQFFVIVHGIRLRVISVWYVLNSVIPILVLIVVPGKYTPWQDHLAAITLLLAWSQGMLHIGRFPKWGIYIVMFTRIARNLVRIFLIFFCVFIAFALSFNIIISSKHGPSFRRPNDSRGYSSSSLPSSPLLQSHLSSAAPENSSTSSLSATPPPSQSNLSSRIFWPHNEIVYSNLLLTFMKTLTMMVGELDFNADMIKVLNYLPGTSHCIFIAFVFLMSILLSNLLVALAVSDVQGLKDKAQVEKLFQQEEVAELMETTCKALSAFFNAISLTTVSRRIHLPSVFSDRCQVFIAANDLPKNGMLVVKRNQCKNKMASVTSHFVSRVRRCICKEMQQRRSCGKVEEELRPLILDQHLSQIKNDMKLLNDKCSQILFKLSNVENRLENLE